MIFLSVEMSVSKPRSRCEMPALRTKRSMLLNDSFIAATNASICWKSLISQTMYDTFTPSLSQKSFVSTRCRSFCPVRKRSHFSSAKHRAMAAPIPELAPVTNAVLLLSFNIILMLCNNARFRFFVHLSCNGTKIIKKSKSRVLNIFFSKIIKNNFFVYCKYFYYFCHTIKYGN